MALAVIESGRPPAAAGPTRHAGREDRRLRHRERPPAVELRGVSVRYNGTVALAGIDLTIAEGEFFSLLGPSGCGKSTTLNVIGGFVDPDEGAVLIKGAPVGRLPSYRRPVNTVFQSYALFPHMTVRENVGFGPRMAGRRRTEIDRAVDQALALVSLSGFEERRPSQLSGGQQQRVALARALANQPAVLLLDEPLGALDLKMRRQMQLELTRIQRETGITFVYVTHDQEEAMTMSDRIAVMNQGMVAQVGTPQEIYEQPTSLFVADFIGTSNILAGELAGSAAGWARVRLATGDEIRVPAARLPVGARRLRIVLRPDHMSLTATPPAAGETNAIPVEVENIAYLGTHRQVALRTADGQGLLVTHALGQPGGGEGRAIGDRVLAVWPAARSLCFADEGGAESSNEGVHSQGRIEA
jgi:spermidine/putrescine transport system ATP-binding protein